MVGGTTVNGRRLTDKRAETRLGEGGGVGIIRVKPPGHDIVDPVERGAKRRPDHAEVVGQPAFEIVRVELPPQGELLGVVQAQDGLRPPFCLGQCRQQNRRQDGDDGNHHQQFYQGKPLPSCFASTEVRETGKMIMARIQETIP